MPRAREGFCVGSVSWSERAWDVPLKGEGKRASGATSDLRRGFWVVAVAPPAFAVVFCVQRCLLSD